MPLTTRFLFAVMLESKSDPFSRSTDDIWLTCVFVKIWVTQSQNPHPLKIAKGAAPRVKIKNKIKNKSKSKAFIVDVWVRQ
jgi:hypothetical protein